jgi:hypothetical protein
MYRLVPVILPPSQSSNESLCIAYLAFLLETVQTSLTGADVYYWFIAGFGNMERLNDSHFAAIDIPIIHATISFVVQGYFCYRIWTLNRRSSKLCVLIALVGVKSPLHPNLQTQDFAPSLQYFHRSGPDGAGSR